MPLTLDSLGALATLPFDDIIDVRAPSEYAEDHIPGARNLPALSDAERARVGTIYVREDRFLARKIGAALVARNVANHLETALTDRAGDWKPLIYCWRGGQRSGAFASILQQIGWQAETVAGGYRSYRRLVVGMLYDRPLPHRVILIDGGTGTAKTRLLHHLATQGAQVIDLEGIAQHRGSLFGPLDHPQPTQKGFDSRLAAALAPLDPARPVYVEAESSRIGRINLPPSLWHAMLSARRLVLGAPLEARARHLVHSYPDMIEDIEKLEETISRLIPYHGHAQVRAWQALARTGDFRTLAAQLVTQHYDPRYAKQPTGATTEDLALPDLSDATLQAAAARIIAQETP